MDEGIRMVLIMVNKEVHQTFQSVNTFDSRSWYTYIIT